MNIHIDFGLLDLLRQLTSLSLSFSGLASIMQQFWTFVMNSLRILGL